MATLRISSVFARSANRLPKNAKAKLAKAFMLLTENPRHPSLQLKKIESGVRKNIYECRLDQFWRIILQETEEMTFDLIYVGAHDEAIKYGAQIREAPSFYDGHPPLLEQVRSYLAGNDQALEFVAASQADLERIAS